MPNCTDPRTCTRTCARQPRRARVAARFAAARFATARFATARFTAAQFAALRFTLLATLTSLSALGTLAPPAHAATHTSAHHAPQALLATASRFLHQKAKKLPVTGQPQITVQLPKRAANLPACDQLTAFLTGAASANASALRPRMSVGLRCAAPSRWSVYLPATLHLPGRYYVAARTLARDQALNTSDLKPRTGDLLRLPRDAVTDPATVVGLRTVQRVARGQVLRLGALNTATIARGQTVTLRACGSGFCISNTGQALAAGTPGQTIPIRTASGHTLTATVTDGQHVEVSL